MYSAYELFMRYFLQDNVTRTGGSGGAHRWEQRGGEGKVNPEAIP